MGTEAGAADADTAADPDAPAAADASGAGPFATAQNAIAPTAPSSTATAATRPRREDPFVGVAAVLANSTLGAVYDVDLGPDPPGELPSPRSAVSALDETSDRPDGEDSRLMRSFSVLVMRCGLP